MISQIPLLSKIIWTPIIAGSLMLLTARSALWLRSLRYIPILTSLSVLVSIGYLFLSMAPYAFQMQYAEHAQWMPALGVEYALGVDGFAALLLALTAFMTLLVLIAALTHVEREDYLKYSATFLIMQGLMSGVFLATDAILFYVFFEAMMIPMFLIIGLWGSSNRVYATLKFILYTFFGSLFFLVALLYLHHLAVNAGYTGVQTFAISTFQSMPIDMKAQQWLFWGLFFAFAIKIPMWPVHTWLPDAHTEAPTGGSVILAAITLKIGGYGMLRFLLPIVPDGCAYFANAVIILSLIAIVYISLVSIVQRDLKKLIAYSSIAHMGFVTLGFFIAFKVLRQTNGGQVAIMGIDGAFVQMISHGFISGALFLCVGVLYSRLHTREISAYGGVVNSMPIFASFFMLFALANVGMPGTVGFVGEFLVIVASFKASFWCALLAASALVLGVAYTLWMYKRVIFGEVAHQSVATLQDLKINEKIVFILLAFAVLVFGIWPNPILDIIRGSSAHLATQLYK